MVTKEISLPSDDWRSFKVGCERLYGTNPSQRIRQLIKEDLRNMAATFAKDNVHLKRTTWPVEQEVIDQAEKPLATKSIPNKPEPSTAEWTLIAEYRERLKADECDMTMDDFDRAAALAEKFNLNRSTLQEI